MEARRHDDLDRRAGTQSNLIAPQDLTRVPLLCPREYDPTTMALVPISGCPLTFAFPASAPCSARTSIRSGARRTI